MRRLLQPVLMLVAWLTTALPAAAQINTTQVVNIGRNALYFEDYLLSIQYFNQAIMAKPFLAEPYFYRAVAKINLEDYNGAEQDASLAIERNPFIVDAYQVRGIARQSLDRLEDAIADYDSGLRLMPENKIFLTNRAVCLAQLERYDEAQAAYDRLLAIDPRNDRGYLGLTHLNLLRGDTVAALQTINHSISLNSNNATAYVMRAEIEALYSKDFTAAVADMDSAIVLDPQQAAYYVNRAYMRYNTDDYYGAMADYDYAIRLNPMSIEGHFNRGLLRAEVGDSNKAIEDFTFVLNQNPDNFMALYNRAMLYYNTGQYRKAVADYDVVLKKYPEFEAGYMMRGEARRRAGDQRGGNADYDKALALFKRKHTHESDFNPAQIEAAAAVRKAQQRHLNGNDEPEDADEIMNKFNTLLTVATDNPVKPEYANRQRGRIQNANVDIEPEPMFELSYHATDNKLNGKTYYMREIAEINDSRLLPSTLTLIPGDPRMSAESINRHFASIDYYNGLLSSSKPRSVDYFARGLDYLMVKNPVAAIADADRALALSKDFALAYFLRAAAHYMQYRLLLSDASEPTDSEVSADARAMLHSREGQQALSAVLADLDECIKRSPNNPYAHYNRGNIHLTMGDETEAIADYNRAIAIKPDLGQAYYNRGLAYLKKGDKLHGVADLSKAGELGVVASYNVLKRLNN